MVTRRARKGRLRASAVSRGRASAGALHTGPTRKLYQLARAWRWRGVGPRASGSTAVWPVSSSRHTASTGLMPHSPAKARHHARRSNGVERAGESSRA